MEAIYYFLNHYGYLGIFLLLALGIFGPPVADEFLLLFLGYLVLKGNLHFIPTVAVVVAGTLTGVSLDYLLGRTLGHYLLHRPDSWLSSEVPANLSSAPMAGTFGRLGLYVQLFCARIAALRPDGGWIVASRFSPVCRLNLFRWPAMVPKLHFLGILVSGKMEPRAVADHTNGLSLSGYCSPWDWLINSAGKKRAGPKVRIESREYLCKQVGSQGAILGIALLQKPSSYRRGEGGVATEPPAAGCSSGWRSRR